jgi:hypothetical protein
MNDVIKKPLDPADLVAVLRRFVAARAGGATGVPPSPAA